MKPRLRVTIDKVGEVLSAIKMLERQRVYVGIPEGEAKGRKASDGPMDNATLAFIHENGSPKANIPARPFLVPGIASVQPQLAEELAAGARALFEKNRPDAVATSYNRAGIIAVAAVKKYLAAGVSPALSPRTLAARKKDGFSGTKPLIRTAQLLNAVTYAIRNRGPK